MTVQFPTQGLPSPRTPWHLWGCSETVTVNQPGPAGIGVTARTGIVQLAKVNYKRPTTWSFWVGGELVTGNVSDVAMTFIAQVNIIIGVGRTIYDTHTRWNSAAGLDVGPPLVEFRWDIPAGTAPGSNILTRKKWTSSARTPLLVDGDATSYETVRWFPAEDIQCSAQCGLNLKAPSAVNNSVTVELTAWFAPRTHVRPDWFADVPDQAAFLGAETKGA